MELICPHCGAKNSSETAAACAACGGSLGAGRGARRAREYDGYAVGRRVLSLAPAWLLAVIAAFVLMLLLFSWPGRRAGEGGGQQQGDAFLNEATNRPASPPAAAREAAPEQKTERTRAPESAQVSPSPAPAPDSQGGAGEGETFSVQVGAFADLSQANEQVSRLRAAGFEARVVESLAATRFRFQVRSGSYVTWGEAAGLATRLRAAGVAGQTVIVEPEGK
jgi:cell division septation protein DedD